MQTARIVQAAVLMLIVALAASCAASKEYTSKLFAPRTPADKDSQAVALRFLTTDSSETDGEDWVTTDIIMGRDTANKTLALDNFAKTFPPASPLPTKQDSVVIAKETKTVSVPLKAGSETEEPVIARNTTPNGVRNKKSREK